MPNSRPDSARLKDQLASNLARLAGPGKRLIVGYSGGADSTCLLHLLHGLGYEVIAAHLHHGLREEADSELRLCEAFAEELGFDFVPAYADTSQISRDHGVGLEEAGRQARYELFRRVCFQFQADHVLTAHTKDDVAETVLLNLIRGTGLKGLAGIPEQRDNILRPMLFASRQETRQHCQDHGLWFHEDPANFDRSVPRSQIRHEILPKLELAHPGAGDNIIRLAEIARKEDDFLTGATAAVLEQCETPLNAPIEFLTRDLESAFDLARFRAFPEVLQARALRLVAQWVGGEMDFDQTNRILKSIQVQEDGSEVLQGGSARCNWTASRLHFESLDSTETFRTPIECPGETLADAFGWRLEAILSSDRTPLKDRLNLDVKVDPLKVKGNLYIRSAEAGDRIQPLGMDGTKLLSDLYQEMRWTQLARRRIPVLCDLVGPIWIPGSTLSHRVRLDEESKGALNLRFGPLKPKIGIIR